MTTHARDNEGGTANSSELRLSGSQDGTSMLLSGESSLPALHRRDSTESSLEVPGTPTNVDGLPQAPTMASPSGRHRPRAQLDEYGARIPRRNDPPPILECPMDFLHCKARFMKTDFKAWVRHSLEHFGDDVKPPGNSRCVFCWTVFTSPIGLESWDGKLACTWKHHVSGSRLRDARLPDHALHRYMWEKGILTKAEWKDLRGLLAESQRRGGSGASGMSPPTSPVTEELDQQMMVMTMNPRRERREERRMRRLQVLDEQVRRDEAEDD